MQGWKNSPVISLDQEDEERGSQVPGYPGLFNETLSQKKVEKKRTRYLQASNRVLAQDVEGPGFNMKCDKNS